MGELKKAKIIILAGQSNAVGVGHMKYLGKHFSKEKLDEYQKGYHVKINYLSHNTRSDGFVKTKMRGSQWNRDTFGPEVAIAEELSKRVADTDYFIVKCAVGSTALYSDWISPSSDEAYDKEAYADQVDDIIKAMRLGRELRKGWCYNELVRIVSDSISLLEKDNYTPEIFAFCWMQGESDAVEKIYAEKYIVRYENLLKDFSARFHHYIKNCLYIDAGISSIWDYFDEVNMAKRRFAEKAENRVYIDTISEGLTTENEPLDNPDIYHYDSDSVIKLGRLFVKYMNEH